jgi:hypothetical protein
MEKYARYHKKAQACRDHELTGHFGVNPGMENHDKSGDNRSSDIGIWESSRAHLHQKIGIPESLDDGMRTGDQKKAGKEQKNELLLPWSKIHDTG